jgi:hypothetical protein
MKVGFVDEVLPRLGGMRDERLNIDRSKHRKDESDASSRRHVIGCSVFVPSLHFRCVSWLIAVSHIQTIMFAHFTTLYQIQRSKRGRQLKATRNIVACL